MSDPLFLKQKHYRAMLADVINRAPIEACGMVAGLEGLSEKVYPITNLLTSPVRFRMEPEEQLKALIDIEDLELELLAIYHSHPTGPETPSATDIVEFAYPGTRYLIWSRKSINWECRAYTISDEQIIEVPIIIIED